MIGAGSWGTTLANLLAEKIHPVGLWVYEKDLFERMMARRENDVFLPGIRLSDQIHLTHSLEDAVNGKAILVCAVPSHVVREVFLRVKPHLKKDFLVVIATKGMEEQSHFTPSLILREVLAGGQRFELVSLAGPSFAKEIAARYPAAVTAASASAEAARLTQELFSRPYLRVYTNPDWLGVELAGAMKNVIAIAAGVSDGLGLGHSSRAALITRGLAEMTRFGVNMGADQRTFMGLAGLGDLVLTCTGDLSRNRQVGLELGRGRRLEEILKGMKMVAEGIRTAKALYELAEARKVELPITKKVYEILYKGKGPSQAVGELMSRELRSEWDSPPP